jgi:hypothetical protein
LLLSISSIKEFKPQGAKKFHGDAFASSAVAPMQKCKKIEGNALRNSIRLPALV